MPDYVEIYRAATACMAGVRRWPMLLLITVVLSPANAVCLDIQFNFLNGFDDRPEAVRGVEGAATIWESVVMDPVAVTIDVGIVPVTELGFAQAITYYSSHIPTYSEVRQALIDDVTSADDQIASSHLPPGPELIFQTSDPQGNIIVNSGNDAINAYLDVPRANARALGLPVENEPGVADAEIKLNEFFLDAGAYDFERTDGISGRDFVGAMLHEIAHALGFMSGVNVLDFYTLPHGPDAPADLSEFAVWNVLDLFRYSQASLPHLDLALGGDPSFSIDGGATNLARFSTGQFNGDGEQPSHWIDGTGLMDPVSRVDEVMTISPLDLRALDVIGWDVRVRAGDFNLDGMLDTNDIDLLVGEIVSGQGNATFDLTDDGTVDSADVAAWLSESASQNGFAAAYLSGDANLDGGIDAADLNAVGMHWLQDQLAWSAGDFTADGVVDAADLNKVALAWQRRIPSSSMAAVPEPSAFLLVIFASVTALSHRRPR